MTRTKKRLPRPLAHSIIRMHGSPLDDWVATHSPLPVLLTSSQPRVLLVYIATSRNIYESLSLCLCLSLQRLICNCFILLSSHQPAQKLNSGLNPTLFGPSHLSLAGRAQSQMAFHSEGARSHGKAPATIANRAVCGIWDTAHKLTHV